MSHENAACAGVPVRGVAVTVTDSAPTAVGTPLITPVTASMSSPAGRPDALNVTAEPSPSLTMTGSVTAVLARVTWSPGSVTLSGRMPSSVWLMA